MLYRGRRIVVYVKMVLHQIVELMNRSGAIWRQRSIGKCLEVEQAGIAPPLSVLGLSLKSCELPLIDILFDVWLDCHPCGDEVVRLSYTTVVGVAEIVPEAETIAHSVVPLDMVEPKQEVFRTCPYIII